MDKKSKRVFAFGLCAALMVSSAATAFADVNTPQNPTDFSSWKSTVWDNKAQFDSAHIVMTPGSDASKMNFAWYSQTAGTPQVKISQNSGMSGANTFQGSAAAITASNGTNIYAASNKVTVTGLTEKTTYYYSYSTDGASWSTPASFNTQSTSSLKMIYVGDPQIGASTGSNGLNIANDTYNWNNTLQNAINNNPTTNFILSAGDQINQADASDASKIRREQEYAGFLYAKALVNYPLVTTVGNHESLVGDYKQHYNNPNSGANLGATAAGCDYYFNYGNALFIVLNSNNRNSAEHDQLMSSAISDPASKNAKWKIVMFHHDVYGSGEPHSDVDGANLRALFAPLMDKYNIDVCLTGHDHSYTRSYQILDGKVINYSSDSQVTDPQGTLYMTANSATGSKFYALNTAKQYYISNRAQQNHPYYSVIDISGGNFTIQTYDALNNAPVDKYSIVKNEGKQSLISLISRANSIVSDNSYASAYTENSRKALQDALSAANALLETGKDGIPTDMFGGYDKTIQGDNPKDKLNYYAYWMDGSKESRVAAGYCAFIDKTMDNAQSPVSSESLNHASTNLNTAISGLVKISAQNGGTHSSPKTGDSTNWLIVFSACLAVCAAAVLCFSIRKRRGNDQ